MYLVTVVDLTEITGRNGKQFVTEASDLGFPVGSSPRAFVLRGSGGEKIYTLIEAAPELAIYGAEDGSKITVFND
jgi:hypothetical protein